MKTQILLLGLTLACTVDAIDSPPPGMTFLRVTTGELVTSPRDANTPAWGDYDGDGNLDLYLAVFSGSDLLFRNHGDGTFTRQTAAIVGPIVGASQINFGLWADFDNDGDLDLFRNSAAAAERLFRNRGDATFENLATPAFATDIQSSFAGAWADYDRDGFVDLAIPRGDTFGTSFAPSQVLVRNDAGTSFSRVTNSTAGEAVTRRGGGTAVAWADFDADGDPDLFVASNASAAREDHLFVNGPGPVFSRLTNGPVATDSGFGFAAAWGDYDNDGFLDLFVANGNGQRNFLYRGIDGGAFETVTTGPVVEDHDPDFSASCAWADYDNDGFLDLYVGNRGRNFLYHNLGDGSFARVLDEPPATDAGTSIGVAWSDYDNDGFVDLVVVNGGGDGPQLTRLYHNAGNTNRWLKLRLTGTASNRSAIGARVHIEATLAGREVRQLREISGGHESGQDDPRPHFGLADATIVDLVRIEWPSGTIQELRRVAPNQIIEVIEPVRLAATVVRFGDQVELRAAAWSGQSFDVEASSDLRTWTRVATAAVDDGLLRFTDPAAANTLAPRFYRLASQDFGVSGSGDQPAMTPESSLPGQDSLRHHPAPGRERGGGKPGRPRIRNPRPQRKVKRWGRMPDGDGEKRRFVPRWRRALGR